MLPLDVNAFRHHLLEATARSLAEAEQNRKAGPLYGFSLVLDRFGSAVAAISQNEEGLQQSVRKELDCWTSAAGNTEELLRKTKRWTGDGWLTFEPLFEAANHLLDKSYVTDPEEYNGGGTTRLVFLSCLEVLAELDVRGVFGKGKQREAIVLNLNVGDQSDEELLRWAVQINPYEVYARFSAEIQEAHSAFDELTYVGLR